MANRWSGVPEHAMAASPTQALFVGSHPALRRALETLDLVADTDATVLVPARRGTGKELVARAIHARRPRARRGRSSP